MVSDSVSFAPLFYQWSFAHAQRVIETGFIDQLLHVCRDEYLKADMQDMICMIYYDLYDMNIFAWYIMKCMIYYDVHDMIWYAWSDIMYTIYNGVHDMI